MRVLLSTIGSRGDVQPVVALALQLRALEQEVRVCVPPDFREWIEGLGIPVTPIGPEVRKATAAAAPPSPEQIRQMVDDSVAAQFATLTAAARDCDVVVAATALQAAARSVAEANGVPYVFAAYSPVVLPSLRHAPPPLSWRGQAPAPATADNRELWARDAERFHSTFGAAVNANRAAIGLPAIDDVRSHMFTDRPWLAADPTLGPWPEPGDDSVVQTGAWILPDDRPLAPELEAFLEAGDPPIYVGFGSTRVPHDLAESMIHTVRELGRRAIVLRGWADLAVEASEPDCLAIGEANLRALLARVAAVVHHGGAGTTTLAGLAGVPQVVMSQRYDQHYWAQRVHELGIGAALAFGTPAAESLRGALEHALRPEVAARARSIASKVRSDGALVAARRLMSRDLEPARAV